MKVLVVFYSRTGHTRRVAERLAEALGGTLAPITDRRERSGVSGYLRSAWEALRHVEARILAPRERISEYDVVLLGTPIWAWKLSSPLRAFARAHARGIRRTAFFCTMGGSGAQGAFAELEAIVGRKPEATLALTEAEVAKLDEGPARRQLDTFVSRLHAADVSQRARRLAA